MRPQPVHYVDNVATGVVNDVAFPLSCIIRFRFDAQEELPPFDLFWYDGGMKPVTPDELYKDGKSFTPEGMMFVGEKGKIIAGFRGEDPVLYSENKPALPLKKNHRNQCVRMAIISGLKHLRIRPSHPGAFFMQDLLLRQFFSEAWHCGQEKGWNMTQLT